MNIVTLDDVPEDRQVARSPSTPPEVLLDLLAHGNAAVRADVLRNPSLPESVMRAEFEANRPDEYLALLSNPNLVTDLLDGFYDRFLNPGPSSITPWIISQSIHFVLGHRNATRELLERGLASAEPLWAVAAASNLNLPTDLATGILEDVHHRFESVRVQVVMTVPLSVLAERDWSTEVSPAVLRMAVDRLISWHGRPSAVVQSAVGHLFRIADDVWARADVALNTTDPAHLLALCQDPDWTVRAEAGNNVACPEEGRVLAALLAK